VVAVALVTAMHQHKTLVAMVARQAVEPISMAQQAHVPLLQFKVTQVAQVLVDSLAALVAVVLVALESEVPLRILVQVVMA
jgi:hypothetical protein